MSTPANPTLNSYADGDDPLWSQQILSVGAQMDTPTRAIHVSVAGNHSWVSGNGDDITNYPLSVGWHPIRIQKLVAAAGAVLGGW